jgi:hypothetical protein
VEHRRPYEALLLLHSRPEAVPPHSLARQPLVVAAVPGEHSRKPQLRRLLEPLVPQGLFLEVCVPAARQRALHFPEGVPEVVRF